MALDGIFLSHLKKEIEIAAIGSRVDKVYQPNKDEIILCLRSKSKNLNLLISSRANSPRIHFTKYKIENPKIPFMICMLFRKKLIGAKLVRIRQIDLDRSLYLDFENINELGDPMTITLAVEIMGKYSNIILIQNNKIIDSIKRVTSDMSSKRVILPGIPYDQPPAQNKLSILSNDVDEILSFLNTKNKNMLLDKALLDSLKGVSPIVCRELAYSCTDNQNVTIANMNQENIENLKKSLGFIFNIAQNLSGLPYLVEDSKGNPIDFSFFNIKQYGNQVNLKKYDTFSELLDEFYYERDSIARMKAKSSDILKKLSGLLEKTNKKIQIQMTELQQCKKKDESLILANLINANLNKINKGSTSIKLENLYDPEYKMIDIKLDPLLNPAQNAQKYYKEYRKAKTAETILKQQIKLSFIEREYLESVLDSLSRTLSESEIDEIKQELYQQGYFKKSTKIKNTDNNKSFNPIKFKSSDGFKILVGKNNTQNDKLTTKYAKKQDIWFHVKDIPGSHVVLVTDNKKPPLKTINEAAIIASCYSKAKNSANVPVDYTLLKYVNKPNGAKPGKVIYKNQKTLYVNPDLSYIKQLQY